MEKLTLKDAAREALAMILTALLAFAALLLFVAFNPAEAHAFGLGHVRQITSIAKDVNSLAKPKQPRTRKPKIVSCDTDADCCEKNPVYCGQPYAMPQDEVAAKPRKPRARKPVIRIGQPYSITVEKITPELLQLCRADENCMDIEEIKPSRTARRK